MTPSATPSQPNQPQYPISTLNLFSVYTSRAAYRQATGQQAPPFNPDLPVKQWYDPSPSTYPYCYFDPNNAAGGYLGALLLPAGQSAMVNLPGPYTYPAYVSPPTPAMIYGPSGPVGAVNPDQICLLADAQEILKEIQPLFPGQQFTIGLLNLGVFYYVYGSEQRRAWTILPPGGWSASGIDLNCQTLIEAKNSHGVGAPGHWALSGNTPTWIYDPPPTQAPAGAQPVPVPIRALLPNEQFALIPPSNPLFGQAAWMVIRTDLPQNPATEVAPAAADYGQQIAALKAEIDQILALLQAPKGS